MSKTFVPSPGTPAVLTANDLRGGQCVWMGRDGWTADPGAAILYDDPASADAALAAAQAQGGIVVGPYLVEAAVDDAGRPAPAHFREAFRQAGPSTEPAARHPARFDEAAHV